MSSTIAWEDKIRSDLGGTDDGEGGRREEEVLDLDRHTPGGLSKDWNWRGSGQFIKCELAGSTNLHIPLCSVTSPIRAERNVDHHMYQNSIFNMFGCVNCIQAMVITTIEVQH
jgi:hypothetical protein